MSSHPRDVEGLAWALRAGSRARLLVIVCSRGHALARVYRARGGPWLLAEQSESEPRPVLRDGEAVAGFERRESAGDPFAEERMYTVSRAEPVAVRVRDADPRDWPVEAVCRCRRASLARHWVVGQLDAGKRRAVAGTP